MKLGILSKQTVKQAVTGSSCSALSRWSLGHGGLPYISLKIRNEKLLSGDSWRDVTQGYDLEEDGHQPDIESSSQSANRLKKADQRWTEMWLQARVLKLINYDKSMT